MRLSLRRNVHVAFLFLAALGAHAESVFVHPLLFPAGSEPVAEAVADFNGDSKVDVLVKNGPIAGPHSLGVVLGNGQGKFGKFIKSPLTFLVSSMTVGDVSGDGIPDVVAPDSVSSPAVLHIMRGTGDGHFTDVALYSVGEDPQPPVLTDMNSDGHLDIVLLEYQAQTFQFEIMVLLNKGDGTFLPGIETVYYPLGYFFVVVDFNGDGKADVATSFCCSGLQILLGKGDGTFQSPRTIDLDSSYALAAADFDGDGIVDLATQQSAGLSVFHGNGDGTFQTPKSYPIGFGGTMINVVDFNGDGIPDIFIHYYGLNDEIILNRGAGQGFSNSVSYRTGLYLGTNIVAGDINGDGYADLVGDAPQSGAIGVLLNRSARFPLAAAAYSTGQTSVPDGLLVADFNGDGSPDAVVGADGDSVILLSRPGGRYPKVFALDMGERAFSMVAADLNGDGKLDIVAATFSDVELLEGNGDGTFAPKQSIDSTQFANQVFAGDFNRDNKSDIAIAIGTEVLVLIGNGDGTFQPAVRYPGSPYAVWLAPADFNGDGKLDFVVASVNSLSLMLGNGDGTFQPAKSIDTGVLIKISAIVSADLNNDGKADLALIGFDDPTLLAVYLGNGDGTFQPKIKTRLRADGSASLVVGDFNKDGKLDIAVGSNGYKTGLKSLRYLLGNGDGTFQEDHILPQTTGDLRYWSMVVSDFNKDGWPDLILADTWGQVVFLPNAAGK